MKWIMIVLPSFAAVFFIAVKMPSKYKSLFFKVPIWLSSTLISLFVGHFMKGVMGPVGVLVSDIVLMPLLGVAKRHHHWSTNRVKVQHRILKYEPTSIYYPKGTQPA